MCAGLRRAGDRFWREVSPAARNRDFVHGGPHRPVSLEPHEVGWQCEAYRIQPVAQLLQQAHPRAVSHLKSGYPVESSGASVGVERRHAVIRVEPVCRLGRAEGPQVGAAPQSRGTERVECWS